MIFTEINFGPVTKKTFEDAFNLLDIYLSDLYQNGQIERYFNIIVRNGEIFAYVNKYGPQADLLKHHSSRGLENYKAVQEFFQREPIWTQIEDDVPKRDTDWKNAPFLYLYACWIDHESPIRRGDNGKPVPTYRIPISETERCDLTLWKSSYVRTDEIWIASGTLEIPAYKELVEPESGLSEIGRELCKSIEDTTGIPTFYYLDRYYAYGDERESQRKCPVCGGKWRSKTPESGKKKEVTFDFRCIKCRLVSDEGVDINSRRAIIGDVKKTRNAKKMNMRN